MKTKSTRIIFTVLTVMGSLIESIPAKAQGEEAAQLVLNYTKLQQLEAILDNMYAGYTILSTGYNKIKMISEGNYSLHQLFIDGLMAVNPTVRNYRRIPYIISYQKLLLSEYKNAYNRFKQDPHFTPDELSYLFNVYTFLIDASIRNLEDLAMIITATKLRMNDQERLQAVDRIFYDMESKLYFLRSFNNNTQLLAIQRARRANDVRTMSRLYGIN
jgi:hypothetical protein